MSFIKRRSLSETIRFLKGFASECASRGGPLTSAIYQLLLEDKFLEVIEFQFDYSANYSIDDFTYARQIQGLVAKQDFLELGIDKEAVAWNTFVEAEEKCRLTNLRLRDPSSADADVSAVFHYAIRKIDRILGDVVGYDSFDFSFGPGATTSTKKAESNPMVKLEANLTCSRNLLPRVGEFLKEFPVWERDRLEDNSLSITLSHAKLQFVPKSSKTLRSIGVEPLLNGLGQKGIGSFLKQRLRRAGIDLSSQQRNRLLAERGSIDGTLATIDLSSASDTVSRELVWQLLPFDWASLLDQFRTGTIEYNGKVVELEKFSSMGNSFTFELETLIFFALTYGTCYHLGIDTEDISVYGDDIIAPVECVALLKSVLEYSGFAVNSAKSFTSGPFRESCGADYLHGRDIRPFYLREKISDRVLFVMHNWLVRHGEMQLAAFVHDWTTPSIRLYGPDGYGDGHLIGSFHVRRNRKLRRCGYDGGYFDSYVAAPRKIKNFVERVTKNAYPTYSIYVLQNRRKLDYLSPLDEREHGSIPGYDVYVKVSLYTFTRNIFNKLASEEVLSTY